MKTTKKKQSSNTTQLLNNIIEAKVKSMLPALIREEVNNQMKLIMEQMTVASNIERTPIKTESITETAKKLLAVDEVGEVDEDDDNYASYKKHSIKFNTKNSAINSILESTQGGIPQTNTPYASLGESYRDLMGKEVFTNNDMGLLPSVQAKQAAQLPPGHNPNSKLDPNTPIGAAVTGALTRNYSELMSKILKK